MYTRISSINPRFSILRAVCIAFILLGISSVAVAGPAMNITRSGAPGSGYMAKGGTLTLRGTGFTPGQSVTVYFSDHPNPSQRGTSTTIGVANSSGSVSASFPTGGWLLGRYAASLRQPGKVSNTGWLLLYDARHSASLSSTNLFQGDPVTLSVRYYAPSSALYLQWKNHPYDTNKTLRIGTTDGNGHARVSFDTSAWAPGAYSAYVFTVDSRGVSYRSSPSDEIGATLASPPTSVTVKPCVSGSGPCELLQGIDFTVSGTGFVRHSSVVARWKSHPIATSVGTTEEIGVSDGNGVLNAQLSSAGWAPGAYVAEVYSATSDGRRTSNVATGAMTVLAPSISIDECRGEGPHEGTGQSGSGPCAMDGSVFHLHGERFPPGAQIVARWTVHPVSTSVGSVDPIGTAASDGGLSADIDSRSWAQGLYEAEIYAQSGGAAVSSVVRMAVRITSPAPISLLGCHTPNSSLDVLNDQDRCYVKRGFPITVYGDEGGFVLNGQLVIEVEDLDGNVDKTLTVPIMNPDASSFAAEFATTELQLGKHTARLYSVASDGYRSSSIAEAKFAIENPDLVFHGYMSVDALTQQNSSPPRFASDAANMHARVNANAVLFNPTPGPTEPTPGPTEPTPEILYDYSWNDTLEVTHEMGMTAFLGISSVFFESGLTFIKNQDTGCVEKIIDHDGKDEAEELTATFYRKDTADKFVGVIPKGTAVLTSTGERFLTLSDAVFDGQHEPVSVAAKPEDVSIRESNHEISGFASYKMQGDIEEYSSIAVKKCILPRADLDLRSDWKVRWLDFYNANSYLKSSDAQAGFYLDEPMWRQITNSELKMFVSEVKGAYPNRPLIVVESGQKRLLDRIDLPEDVDWFGIDTYRFDPLSDEYKQLIDQAQALIRPYNHMKLIIVGDAFSLSSGLLETDAPEKYDYALKYYELARFTERVVALGWYAWSLTKDRQTSDESALKGLEQLIPHSAQNKPLERVHADIGAAVLRTGP